MTAPTRPVLRWHGGKWRLAPWIIAQFPPHRVYVEPFGGAGSVLLRKPRAYAEVYNDLDGEVVNLFRVLRGPLAGELVQALRLTPFARAEFEAAYEPAVDPVEAARRLIARSFMGIGSCGVFGRTTGFRANANASGQHNTAMEWAGYPEALEVVIERLRGVVIEKTSALDIMRRSDRPDTLHYVDPPYLPETRSRKMLAGGKLYHAYSHEMDEADHAELLAAVQDLTGAVVISAYPSALYDEALAGWRRLERAALADRARARTEVLWLNARAEAGHGLFEEVGA